MYIQTTKWCAVLRCAVILVPFVGTACTGHDAQSKSGDRSVHGLMQRMGKPDAYEVGPLASPEFGLGTPKITSGDYRLYYLAQDRTFECNGEKVVGMSEVDPLVKSMILAPL